MPERSVDSFFSLMERVMLDTAMPRRQTVLENACNSLCFLFQHAGEAGWVRNGVVRLDLVNGEPCSPPVSTAISTHTRPESNLTRPYAPPHPDGSFNLPRA